MGDRVILHSDCNCFYASVEMLYHPEYDGKPLAVGGDPEERHGIVLTANYIAKRRGVKTGSALWEARQVCPDIIFVPPRMDLYLRFSRLAREIYMDYTDRQEAFGIDECWLDVTESASCLAGSRSTRTGETILSFSGEPCRRMSPIRSGEKIAREINRRIREELGITVSVGVSWNKIFAKLGSDYKKPDAVTVFSRGNYREKINPLPVGDLLYVGRATERKLKNYGVHTIGELAEAEPAWLENRFGKVGLMLSMFARGEDRTPVSRETSHIPVKSIGNSTTTPRDLTTEEDVRLVCYMLSESVASRLRKAGFIGDVIEVYARDSGLSWYARQHRIDTPTSISGEIEAEAMRLFRETYPWKAPVRSFGVRVSGLREETDPFQLSLFRNQALREKQMGAERAVDEIRRRYGWHAVQRGIMYRDSYLASLNATADDHMIHPHGYLERGNRTGVENWQPV